VFYALSGKENAMAENFDPYHRWLGISPKDQPPNHYRLLAIDVFEDDPDVIANAADQRMAHVRSFQVGQHSALSQRLLNEIAAARICLLNAARKAEYDGRLRAELAQAAVPAANDLEPSPMELDFAADQATGVEKHRSQATSATMPWQAPAAVGAVILTCVAVAAYLWATLSADGLPSGTQTKPVPLPSPEKSIPSLDTPRVKLQARDKKPPAVPSKPEPEVEQPDPALTPEGKTAIPKEGPPPKPKAPPSATPDDNDLISTAIVGGQGGGPFEEAPTPRRLLVGFKTTTGSVAFKTATGQFSSGRVVRSIQPIYSGSAPDDDAKTYGQVRGEVTTVEAKQAYAVGGVIAKGGILLDGFKVIFMRVGPTSLDTTDSYESEWIGGRGGGPEQTLGGDGKRVVGIYGRSGLLLDALGLIQAK
jgi:hypothetical protein